MYMKHVSGGYVKVCDILTASIKTQWYFYNGGCSYSQISKEESVPAPHGTVQIAGYCLSLCCGQMIWSH